MSVDAYFEYLAQPDSEKLHWVNGEIFGMAGGTVQHSRIKSRVQRILGQLDGKSCEGFDSDLMVHIEETELFCYPDATIVCGEPKVGSRNGIEYVENPSVVFEVLSPSTLRDDLGVKLNHYMQHPGVHLIVLISSMKIEVQTYERKGAQWLISTYTNLADSFIDELTTMRVKLSDLYDGIDFSA